MGLIDTSAEGLRGSLVLELVLLRGVPEARIVDGGDVEVLCHSGDPGGDPLLARMVVGHNQGDLVLCQLISRSFSVLPNTP